MRRKVPMLMKPVIATSGFLVYMGAFTIARMHRRAYSRIGPYMERYRERCGGLLPAPGVSR
jgi:hypothetical protein